MNAAVTEASMRGFRVMFVVAAICGAARAEASLPPSQCVEWAWVLADGGAPSSPPVWLTEDPEITIDVEPSDGGGIEVPPPPQMRKVCTRMGWPDRDGVGCSAALGLPLGGAALALLALLARRPRRGPGRGA